MNPQKRVSTLDALRGVIIIVMALDHANYFIAQQHPWPEFWAFVFPTYETAPAFLTRLITHLAAPGFFFLMGAGMWLFTNNRETKGWARPKIMAHFAIRGTILIALQFLLENPAWRLIGPWPETPYFGVLFGLGGAMILATLFLWLPSWALGVFGSLGIVGSWFAISTVDQQLALATQVDFKHLLYIPTIEGNVFYSIIPWVFVVLLGMFFAKQLQAKDETTTFRIGGYVGLGMLITFFGLRWAGQFGNTRPAISMDWINFLNLVKYPPSIVFLLLTLGVNLLLLLGLSKLKANWLTPLSVFGRVPLFFYLAHLYLYGLLGRFFFPDGTKLGVMVLVWVIGLAILYPLCLWYGQYKQKHADNRFLHYL